MNYIIIIFLYFLISCGYPDLDSKPKFSKLKLSKEESIDLCKISNSDNTELQECLEKIEIKE